MTTKERQDSEGDSERSAWAMTGRWSLSGDYASLPRYTVTTLIADDAIPERAIKIGLCPLISRRD